MAFPSLSLLLLATWFTSTSASSCCQKVFLSAKEVLDREQGALLGEYTRDVDQTFADKPVYSKKVGQFAFYLFYKPNGTLGIDSPGWTVSSEPGGRSLNIVTRASDRSCPEGIRGAYDRDLELDSTFKVECLDEPIERTKICCEKLLFNATNELGPIASRQPALMGVYTKNGTYNDFDVYYLNFFGFESFLYRRRLGRASDGWTISQKVGSESFAITTRDTGECPSGIEVGFERNRDRDQSLDVRCVHNTTDRDFQRLTDNADNVTPNCILLTSINLLFLVVSWH